MAKKTAVKAKPAKHPHHAKASSALATIEKDIRTLDSEVSTLKHSLSKKTKAHKSTKHKKATASKKRGLAIGDSVACCAAEALAASARLQGFRVSDEDVLALYWHTAGDPDAGATIEATLEAAWRFRLGGVRPAWRVADPGEVACAGLAIPDHRSLILGVELPGPHTVLAAPDGWWSWGEPFDPAEWPDAVVEEAWAVTWT